MKVLSVFPELHGVNPGGVQVSAQIAWDALERQTDAQALIATNRLSALRQALRVRFEPDVILFWHLDLLRLAPLLRMRAPRVLFLHGIEAWRRQGLLTRRLLRTTQLLANSRYTLERAQASNPELVSAPARLVPLGLGVSDGAATAPAAVPAAVMIGRLDARERYKGHHEIIRCWREVRLQIPEAQLWIVGDGDLRAELEVLASKEQVADSVRFFGRVSEAEKDALIRAARCLALPSRAEGFGLVYLEAMRLGRPCLVGTDAGGEVIQPPAGGLRVDPADRRELVQSLIQLLERSEQWRQSTRARYDEHFTAAKFQARLLDALRQVG